MPRKRAPNGSGNIRIRPNGKYQARVTVGIDPQTGKYKYSFQTFDTETEARIWATGTQAEIDSGTYVKPSKQTMNEWLDIWLETCTDKLKDVGMVKSRVVHILGPSRRHSFRKHKFWAPIIESARTIRRKTESRSVRRPLKISTPSFLLSCRTL